MGAVSLAQMKRDSKAVNVMLRKACRGSDGSYMNGSCIKILMSGSAFPGKPDMP